MNRQNQTAKSNQTKQIINKTPDSDFKQLKKTLKRHAFLFVLQPLHYCSGLANEDLYWFERVAIIDSSLRPACAKSSTGN